jgi:hypothetical protein
LKKGILENSITLFTYLKTLLFENFDTKEIESANEWEREIDREGEKTKDFGKRKREDKEKSKTQI